MFTKGHASKQQVLIIVRVMIASCLSIPVFSVGIFPFMGHTSRNRTCNAVFGDLRLRGSESLTRRAPTSSIIQDVRARAH